MSDDNPLLEALDDLTKPERRKVIQDGPIGTGLDGQKVATVELPPLLDQLTQAIRASIGGSSRGASLAFEGAVLNTAALFTAMKISAQIGDWCRMVGVKPVKDSTKDLRAWYVARQGTRQESDEWHTQQLRKWAGQIRGLLDPPRERDLDDACPTCGATAWWDQKTGTKFLRPLVIQYRPHDPDMIQQAKALCKACDAVWGVRALAYELEARHAEGGDAEAV